MTIDELCTALTTLEETRRKTTGEPWNCETADCVSGPSRCQIVRIVPPELSGDISDCEQQLAIARFIVAARNLPFDFAKLAELVRNLDAYLHQGQMVTIIERNRLVRAFKALLKEEK